MFGIQVFDAFNWFCALVVGEQKRCIKAIISGIIEDLECGILATLLGTQVASLVSYHCQLAQDVQVHVATGPNEANSPP